MNDQPHVKAKLKAVLPKAAALVICARGVSAVPLLAAIIMPVLPGEGSVFNSRVVEGPNGPYEARKHARLPPAGPAPTIRRSVLIGLIIAFKQHVS